jgi:hypothetical protein
VEGFRRTQKAAMMCQADQQWTETLLLVLLGIRTAFKEDLLASVAELIYDELPRIPGKLLLTPTAGPVNSGRYITELPQHIGPSQGSSGSTPRLPGYICAEQPREVHARLHPSGHNAPGFGAPLLGPVTEREDTATPRARQAQHRVNRQGQAGLHAE